nr:immunoglobulin heavy chain junction region [Macaca mulatta]
CVTTAGIQYGLDSW